MLGLMLSFAAGPEQFSLTSNRDTITLVRVQKISEGAAMTESATVEPKLALITGASSGIGRACAEVLASRGYDLILTARRSERLEILAQELAKKSSRKIHTSAFDISDSAATEKAMLALAHLLPNVTVLINNAGLALGTQPFAEGALSDWQAMLDTNVKGLLQVTRTCVPHFKNAKRGHIVNLGSVAGRYVYPGGAVYCATKFAVRAITEGLRFDLLGTGVRVTNIEPGMVETEFSKVRFGGDEAKAKAVYQNMTPLSAHDIAETIAWCLERPAHVNIQELVIYPTDQASVGPYVHRHT